MNSIPLPALDIQPPPQQPGPMQMYGNLMKLQALRSQVQQQQAEAPLRQQALQQQVQSGSLAIQNQQMQQRSALALMGAFSGLDPKDPDYFQKGLAKAQSSGQVLPQQLQGVMNAAMDFQTKHANLTKTQQGIAQNRADSLHALGTGYLQEPDSQMATDWPTIRQKVVDLHQGEQNFDPNSIPQQFPGRQWVQANTVLSGMSAAGMRAAGTQQSAQASTTRANTHLFTDPTTKQSFYGEIVPGQGIRNTATGQMVAGANPVLASGNSVDQQALAAYLQAHPGKTAADYVAWKAKQAPYGAIMMTNLMGGTQNNAALDFAADNYRKTGQLPSFVYRSPATGQAIINRAAQMDQQDGGLGIAGNKAILQANEHSLQNLQKNYDQVQAFEGTAEKNIDLLQTTAKSIPDLSQRWANVPVRMINSKMLGTANMASFNTALNTAQTEAAKVLNSANATGVLSDTARHELQQIVDGNLSYPAMVASLTTLKQDMSNRTQSYQLQIRDIQRRIGGAGSPKATEENGTGQTQPNAGGGGASGLSVTAPNGKTYTFKDQASADAFKKNAGIQ